MASLPFKDEVTGWKEKDRLLGGAVVFVQFKHACLCVLNNIHTYRWNILTGQTLLTVSILLASVIYRLYELVIETKTHIHTQPCTHTFISLYTPTLFLYSYKDLPRNHCFSCERANPLQPIKYFWAHGADYSKLINRHVMNKNTLIMKRGCPVPPFRLAISMRTHVVDGWRVATSILRQPQMPSLD